MNSMVVPSEGFPRHRKATCCKKECLVGESVMVSSLPNRQDQVVFHKRCLGALLAKMPDDRSIASQRYHRLRKRMLETGKVFPA